MLKEEQSDHERPNLRQWIVNKLPDAFEDKCFLLQIGYFKSHIVCYLIPETHRQLRYLTSFLIIYVYTATNPEIYVNQDTFKPLFLIRNPEKVLHLKDNAVYQAGNSHVPENPIRNEAQCHTNLWQFFVLHRKSFCSHLISFHCYVVSNFTGQCRGRDA